MIDFLENISWQWAFLLAFIENVLICFISLYFSDFLIKKYKYPISTSSLNPLNLQKKHLIWITIIANTGITCIGFVLFSNNIIKLTSHLSWEILWHFLVLLLTMDFLMFLFHFIIHKTLFYRILHLLHHQEKTPTPVDLFVLHPLEVVGFGGLWIIILCLFPFNIYAIIIYAFINLLFGIIGHLGIEPFPAYWVKKPILRYIGTSTFHFQHHQYENCNFGFYTIFWDILFKTLHPSYFDTFIASKMIR